MSIRAKDVAERFRARCHAGDEESMDGQGRESECREGVARDVDVCKEAEEGETLQGKTSSRMSKSYSGSQVRAYL